MTSVIHIRDAPTGWKTNDKYVYIGRRNMKLELPQSPFHNPEYMAQEEDRTDCCDAYQVIFDRSMELQDLALEKLKDKILVCFCAPRRCHGHILATFVNENSNEC